MNSDRRTGRRAHDLVRQKQSMADFISNSKSYQDLLARLKTQIRTAQVRAAVAVNQELVLLYWQIGKEILTRQKEITRSPSGRCDTGIKDACLLVVWDAASVSKRVLLETPDAWRQLGAGRDWQDKSRSVYPCPMVKSATRLFPLDRSKALTSKRLYEDSSCISSDEQQRSFLEPSGWFSAVAAALFSRRLFPRWVSASPVSRWPSALLF